MEARSALHQKELKETAQSVLSVVSDLSKSHEERIKRLEDKLNKH
jgi:hypothetical protein